MTGHSPQKLFLPGPQGQLQALYHPGDAPLPAVVVCHPHPQYGGTMRNKVVYWMARAFETKGHPVLRFNFRGVEQSDGEWAGGTGEADDAAAALEWMHGMHPEHPLWLAGFSFGCYAGLQAAHADRRVQRMFAVAPAVNMWSFDFLAKETRPLTVVAATADEIVPFDQLQQWGSSHPAVAFHTIVGAGHFFPDHMQQMMEALVADV